MYDIAFDITTREIIMKGNDFFTTINPSNQNGGNILYSRCANPLAPMTGIGILEIIGANGSKAAFEMNRWQAQTLNDGATIAKWKSSPLPDNDIAIDIKQSYL
jgi:hypothetical protein